MPPRRWGDILTAVVIAIRVERLVRFAGLEKAAKSAGVTLALDGTAAPVGAAGELSCSARELEKLDTAWRVLRVRPFNATCLRRALVGGYFLRHRHPALRVGVRKENGAVSAHAWIEVDGIGLDPDGGAYAVLRTPDGGSAS